MPESVDHSSLIDLFRNDPSLVTTVLTDCLGEPLL
jgi:hypothetical protein